MVAIQSNNGKSGRMANPADLALGGLLQCVEAATLGMPFEVWKTRMGRYRGETTIQAFVNVYKRGGVSAFWAGTSAKMVESGTKGAILLFSKEAILQSMQTVTSNQTINGIVAGAGGGICQVTVMGPCTFLVTAVVTGDKNVSISSKIKQVWAKDGIKGFYPGGTALAFRQASNWASRQGITEFVREQFKDKNGKLTVTQEAISGIIGGALSCWNHPFEVARIEMQAAASTGEKKQNMMQVFRMIVKENGPGGLFKGIVPRILLGVWQTLFMVTGAKLVTQHLQQSKK